MPRPCAAAAESAGAVADTAWRSIGGRSVPTEAGSCQVSSPSERLAPDRALLYSLKPHAGRRHERESPLGVLRPVRAAYALAGFRFPPPPD